MKRRMNSKTWGFTGALAVCGLGLVFVQVRSVYAHHAFGAEFDPNRDEAIVYAQRLMEAGVPVELHQWRGTFHGSQAVLSADVSQRQIEELGTVLHHALAG